MNNHGVCECKTFILWNTRKFHWLTVHKAFDIQGPDDVGPYNSFDGAMSRPPSRMSNNKSPMGKIIDLSADAAAGTNLPYHI